MGMTERDKKLMMAVVGIVILGGFWLLMLGPKRSAVSAAEEDRNNAAKELADAKAAVSDGNQNKKTFRVSYAQLVKLGKAVPSEDDEVSMIIQMNDMAKESGVAFVKLAVSEGGANTAVPGASSSSTGTEQKTTCDEGASSSTGATTATGPSAASGPGQAAQDAQNGANTASGDANRAAGSGEEPSCANAPTATDLAAAAAGLQVDSFELTFGGNFYGLHEFFEKVHKLVQNRNGRISTKGRLLQVSKIDLKVKKFPVLEATVSMTGYRLPKSVDASAGASPSGPAPASTPTASAPPAATGGVR